MPKKTYLYKTLLPALLVLSAGYTGCDTDDMCHENAECETMCRTYDSNHLYYACKDARCVCLSKEALACTGTKGETTCTDLCATFAPESDASCENNLCVCSQPSAEP